MAHTEPSVSGRPPIFFGLILAWIFVPSAANAVEHYEVIYANKSIAAEVGACLSKKFERTGKGAYTNRRLSTLKFFTDNYNATLGVKDFSAVRDFYHLEVSSDSDASPLIVTVLSLRRPWNGKIPETKNNDLHSKAPMKYEGRASQRFVFFAQTESRSITDEDRRNFSYAADCFEANAR